MEKIKVNLKEKSYDVSTGYGLLELAKELFNLDRKILILTDSGVPAKYSEAIKNQCKNALIYTIEQGEESKNIKTYATVLEKMLEFGLTRSDAIVGVGGGVVGDLTGFLASTYMRGIDFYNVPTTLLAMVDSSIGGKTAIDFGGVKNSVGTFYQPKGVLIDLDVLDTLSDRQFSNGLSESIKMALTSDEKLFEILKTGEFKKNIDKIVIRSLNVKRSVVEQDETEKGLRKVLNFGHTFAHAIEANEQMQNVLHGEAVAIGMTIMCSKPVLESLVPVLKMANLPTRYDGDVEKALNFVWHDKKVKGDTVDVVTVSEIGKFRFDKYNVSDFIENIKSKI